jgi:hypothetical protein
MKWLYTLACYFALTVAVASSQDRSSAGVPPITAPNEVAGLKLPAAQTVNYDEGFISLTADCKGTVKWLVLSTSVKVKFKVNPATPNDIDVAVPPYESGITVFAIGVVEGKQTDFARTDITVKGPAGPGPPPTPIPPDVKGPFHLSIVEDPTKRTDAIRNVIESNELRTTLKNKQVALRVYTTTDPEVKEKKFDAVLQRFGAPLMVLQDDNGKGLVIGPLSQDVPSLLKLLVPYIGGQ